MPEGDTLQQARLRVLPILEGRELEFFWARKLRGHRPRAGQLIDGVRVHGKNLLIDFDRKLTLRVHLGMGGYWRTLDLDAAPGAVDRARSNHRLRIELGTAAGSALCFSAPGVETFLRGRDLTPISNLGPDLSVPPESVPETVETARRRARLRCDPTEMIADVLLDQEVAAGIGNVYKSEVLFLVGVHPLTSLRLVSDAELVALYERAAELLYVHSQPGNSYRVTTPARFVEPGYRRGPSRRPASRLPRHYVYERWQAPCLRCHTPVRRSFVGRMGRSTYWCPTCQPARTDYGPPASERRESG